MDSDVPEAAKAYRVNIFIGQLGRGAMHLVDPKPEEKQEVVNVFADIENTPRWHWWMEVAIRVAAILTIGEFLYRLWPA